MKYTWLIYMNGDKRLAPIAVEYIKFIKTLKLRGVDIVLLEQFKPLEKLDTFFSHLPFLMNNH